MTKPKSGERVPTSKTIPSEGERVSDAELSKWLAKLKATPTGHGSCLANITLLQSICTELQFRRAQPDRAAIVEETLEKAIGVAKTIVDHEEECVRNTKYEERWGHQSAADAAAAIITGIQALKPITPEGD